MRHAWQNNRDGRKIEVGYYRLMMVDKGNCWGERGMVNVEMVRFAVAASTLLY